MMLIVNAYRKRLDILIEDNRSMKWNYFYLDYDANGDFYLGKNASENTVEANKSLNINNVDYTNVFAVTSWKNDKLWFSLQKGVIKAELADGRTWQKK